MRGHLSISAVSPLKDLTEPQRGLLGPLRDP